MAILGYIQGYTGVWLYGVYTAIYGYIPVWACMGI